MKTKKFSKKLSLSKVTVARLNHNEIQNAKGGGTLSFLSFCTSWQETCDPCSRAFTNCPNNGCDSGLPYTCYLTNDIAC